MRLRDRDAIVTREGLIFRVFGYTHPQNAYICDIEYAPSSLFKSDNPKAPRGTAEQAFYKFYEDEGWKFLESNFPKYLVLHEMLGQKTIGVDYGDIAEVRKSEEALEKLVERKPEDELVGVLQTVLEFVTKNSGLSPKSFGVFGSVLHGFYHPKLSDIDFVVYGRKELSRLCETLREQYQADGSVLANEFDTAAAIRGKLWRFKNLSPEEFVRHQCRKLIYALFNHARSGRVVKTEFEPVKRWEEISSEYDSRTRIVQKGWVKMLARVTDDADAPFMPSVYGIEPTRILGGSHCASEAVRIVSFMEEFRMQARRDETVCVEGNLEEVTTKKGSFHQVALTYCPRYYEQVLKVASPLDLRQNHMVLGSVAQQ
jgi:predicted nucleotidyltransferase